MFKRQFWRQEKRRAKYVQPNDLTDAQLNIIADKREAGTAWKYIEAEFGLCQNCASYVMAAIKKRTGRDIVSLRSVRRERPAPEVVAVPLIASKPEVTASFEEYDVVTLIRRGHSRQYIASKTRAKYSVIEAAFKRFAPDDPPRTARKELEHSSPPASAPARCHLDARRQEKTPAKEFVEGAWTR